MKLPTASVVSPKLSAPPAQTPQLQASTDMAARRIQHPRPASKDLGVARSPRCHLTPLEAQPNPTTPKTPKALHYGESCRPRAQPVSGRPKPASGSHVCRPCRHLPASPGASLVPTPSSFSKRPHLFHREKLKKRKDQMPIQKVRDASSQVVLRHLAGGKGALVR